MTPLPVKADNAPNSIPNLIRTLAQSPHSLEGYLQLNRALSKSKLPPRLREQIALVVAQPDFPGLHTHDPKTNAALRFARDFVIRIEPASIKTLHEAGFDHVEIVEIVACVSLHLFEKHFHEVTRTAHAA